MPILTPWQLIADARVLTNPKHFRDLDDVLDEEQVRGEEVEEIGQAFGESLESERRQLRRGLGVGVVSDVPDAVVGATVEHSSDERRYSTQARHRDADGRQERPQRLRRETRDAKISGKS